MTKAISHVRSIREDVGLSQEQLARILGTSWVSVSRWERKVARPNTRPEARLKRLEELVNRIGKALPKAGLQRFMDTPQPLLHGFRPVDLLESEYAFRDLLAFVDAAKSGDMA